MSAYIVEMGFWLRAYDGVAVKADSNARAIEKAKAAAKISMESADHPEHIEIGERREGTIAFIDRITTGGRRHPAIEVLKFDDDRIRDPPPD